MEIVLLEMEVSYSCRFADKPTDFSTNLNKISVFGEKLAEEKPIAADGSQNEAGLARFPAFR